MYNQNNIKNKNLYNGLMGKIQDIKYDEEIQEYQMYLVMENGWEGWEGKQIKYKTKGTPQIYSECYCLQPAYALNLHKTQGLTITKQFIIDMENMYRFKDSFNQSIYVALSRSSK